MSTLAATFPTQPTPTQETTVAAAAITAINALVLATPTEASWSSATLSIEFGDNLPSNVQASVVATVLPALAAQLIGEPTFSWS